RRASHGAGDAPLRPRDRAQLRPHDCGGDAGRGAAGPGGDRGVPRRCGRRGRRRAVTALLELEDVEARYGPVRALRGVSLEVADGEIVAVLGANGAGKTTTLRAVSGTVRASGSVRLDGRPLRGGPEGAARAGVAHVPEGRGTFAELSVLDNLRLGAYVRRGSIRHE